MPNRGKKGDGGMDAVRFEVRFLYFHELFARVDSEKRSRRDEEIAKGSGGSGICRTKGQCTKTN